MVHLEQLFWEEEFVRISPTLLVPYKYIASCEGTEVVMKKMPWTRKPLTFTIDAKNSNEISERIANHLALDNKQRGRRDDVHIVSTGDGQHNRRDGVHTVSTSGRKRRRTPTVSKEKAEAVFAFVQSHPGTRSAEITAGTSISQSTVERCLAELRKQGRIEYVGSKKNGGYEAVKTPKIS